ncbi:hypothetical protein MMC09_003509 [Bachmanniomyces sp. S44760]|nr:hypothetical protein [Bachmanniomyces sp. S44760]
MAPYSIRSFLAGQTSAAPSASKEFSELSKKQISAVFGPTVPADVGNEILARLQHQRTTGTLDSGFNAPGVDEQLLLNALAWLRATYPMDEDAAIIARLDEEEREEERALLAKAEKIGLYKPQQSAEKDGIYGKSQLEAIRHENEMKYEEELQAKQTQKSQADEIRNLSGDSEIIQDSQRRAVVARRTQSAEWVKKYKERAVLSQDTKPPEMSKIRRLLPAGIVTLVVVGACYFLAQNYVPPPRVARLFPDIPPAAATYVGLFVMNAVVLVMWRIPPFWRFMNQYFLIIPGAPRATSILGNVISHQSIMHFSGNMLVLWFIGTQLHDEIGRGKFLGVYFASGVIGSYFSFAGFVLRNNLTTASLGASGALAGVIGCYLYLHSGEKMNILFLPPDLVPAIPANFILSLLITIEILAILRGSRKVDNRAHLGGYLAGIAGANLIRKQREQQRQAEIEIERTWASSKGSGKGGYDS